MADHRLRLHDARELVDRDVESPAKRLVPHELAAVRETGEVQVSPVDEGVAAVQPAKPQRDVAARLNKRVDAFVVGRALVFPPENFWPVIEAGGLPAFSVISSPASRCIRRTWELHRTSSHES